MRNIYLTFTLFIFGLLLNCNKINIKESKLLNTKVKTEKTEKTETKEVFSYLKANNNPIEPLYRTLYNGYSISIDSNSSNQMLTFENGESEITKVLKFYYETPEIVFHLYKSDLNNFIILIEGRDYYASNLGVYYVDKKLSKIIEIDDALTYNQDDPETLGFKVPTAEIIKNDNVLKYKIFLGKEILFDKTYKFSSLEINNSTKKNAEEKIQNQTSNKSSTKGPQKISVDLNIDGKKENFIVNFYDANIKGNKNFEKEIFFDKNFLIIKKEFEENNPHDFISYKYFFNEINSSVILDKVEFSRETYVENVDICKINYTYLPNHKIYLPQVDFFSNKFLKTLSRDINLTEAIEITTKINQNYNCTSQLSKTELIFLRNNIVLDNNSVQNYNNLAYYLEQRKQYEESIYLLKNILEKYPLRVVAWLNYGDSLWEVNDKSQAKIAYQKYLYLMKSQRNNVSKIPQRVYDRI